MKCKSTFVRRDLLLRHDRTVHAKDGEGGAQSQPSKRRSGPKTSSPTEEVPNSLDPAVAEEKANQLEPLDSADDMVDIEAAAMLMHDFHHKAMASHDPDPSSDTLSAISPHGPSLMDTSSYGSAAMSLPQMPWDTLVPHTASEARESSVSTAHMHGPDPPMAFADGDLHHPHPGPLPTMMEPNGHGSEGLSAMHGPLSLSDMDTQGVLSPMPPSMMGPVSPVDYRRSPGPSHPLTMAKAPQVLVDEQCTRILENIKRCDSEVALLETFRLPNRTVLNRYLAKYFDLFHHHLPFIHQASFDPTEVAAPLLLAVLSIGALYTFEHDQAYMLHIGSRVLVNQFLQKKENFSSRKCPLWAMQSTLLNSVFASWSGDAKGLEWACSIKSLLANVSLPLRL